MRPRSRPGTTDRSRSSSGRRSPIRSPAASRCFASSPARSRQTRPSTTCRKTLPSASATSSRCRERIQTQVPEVKAGDLGAVAKLKETQTGDTLGDKAAGTTFAPLALRRAAARLRHRAQEPGRRRQDQLRAPPTPGRGSDDSLLPRPRPRNCSFRSGTTPHRGHGRQVEAPIRRRGQPESAEDRLSRNDQRFDRSARPPQEADWRSRPVRRLQDHGRAPAARRRVRVRRRGLRRLDPEEFIPAVEKGIQEAPAERLSRRLSDGRLQATVFDGKYHAVDSSEMSFKMAGWLAYKDAMRRAQPTSWSRS